jgi:hypothetical protein
LWAQRQEAGEDKVIYVLNYLKKAAVRAPYPARARDEISDQEFGMNRDLLLGRQRDHEL